MALTRLDDHDTRWVENSLHVSTDFGLAEDVLRDEFVVIEASFDFMSIAKPGSKRRDRIYNTTGMILVSTSILCDAFFKSCSNLNAFLQETVAAKLNKQTLVRAQPPI